MKITRAQNILLSLPFYIWAFAASLAVPVLFIGLGEFSHNLVQLPFMKVHPRYTGGDIAFEYTSGNTQYAIHEPVFQWLLDESEEGFIQVDITHSGNTLEKAFVDIDNDKNPDFTLEITEKNGPAISALSPQITQLERWAKTENGWILRLGIVKENTEEQTIETM